MFIKTSQLSQMSFTKKQYPEKVYILLLKTFLSVSSEDPITISLMPFSF